MLYPKGDMMEKEKTFEEFIQYWKVQGYEVHMTESALKSLEEMEKPKKLSVWDILSFPFEMAEDIFLSLPRNHVTRYLSGWMATLAIMANNPLYRQLTRRGQKTYRIA